MNKFVSSTQRINTNDTNIFVLFECISIFASRFVAERIPINFQPEAEREKAPEVSTGEAAAKSFLEGFSLDAPLYEKGKFETAEMAIDFGRRLQALESTLVEFDRLPDALQKPVLERLGPFIRTASYINSRCPEVRVNLREYIDGLVENYLPKDKLNKYPRRTYH